MTAEAISGAVAQEAQIVRNALESDHIGVKLSTFDDLMAAAVTPQSPGEKPQESPFDKGFPPTYPVREYPKKYLIGRDEKLHVIYAGVDISSEHRLVLVETQEHSASGIVQGWYVGRMAQSSFQDQGRLLEEIVRVTAGPPTADLSIAIATELSNE